MCLLCAQGLSELQNKYGGLEVLAFPCNQFGAQEPGDSKSIKSFAAAKGFKGPLFAKVDVNGSNGAHRPRLHAVLVLMLELDGNWQWESR